MEDNDIASRSPTATSLYETRLALKRFGFGVTLDRQMVAHYESASPVVVANAVFQNDRKRLAVQFETFNQWPLDSSPPTVDSDSGLEETRLDSDCCEWRWTKYEFVADYCQLKQISFADTTLCVHLSCPPLLYRLVTDYHQSGALSGVDHYSDSSPNADSKDDSKDDPNDDPDSDRFSDISFDSFDLSDYHELDDNDNDFNGLRLRVNSFDDADAHYFTMSDTIYLRIDERCLDSVSILLANIRLFDANINLVNKSFRIEMVKTDYWIKSLLLKTEKFAFNIRYAIQAICDYSYLFIDALAINGQTFEQFIDKIDELLTKNEKVVERALNEMMTRVESGVPFNPIDELQQLYMKHDSCEPRVWPNDSIKLVRRCILTPTRVLLLPAMPLQESRFLRVCEPEYAIRVLIKDEDFQQMSFSVCKTSVSDYHNLSHEYLSQTITERLISGLEIGGRVYEFIGASTSQLRDHGMVLYARDSRERNARMICEEIGELTGITNPAKYISRIGLSMSASMAHVSNVNCVQMIDDIKGGLNKRNGEPYVFSDGVGMVSPSMAKKLANSVSDSEIIPSTYQIRMAGIKGIVVINPDLVGDVIQVRPSMKKFHSDSSDLYILKMSEPRSVYLNRPLITIMDAMGVEHSGVLELLHERLRQLSNALQCDCKAIDIMKTYSMLRQIPFKLLLESGVSVLNEPFFANIVRDIIRKVGSDLKNKARILIPLNEGRVMYGVIDETRSLQRGEVFVQYTDVDNGAKKILEGQILVTKYPCMHEGDVRKFNAVNAPKLHHIVDCIVFPAVGDRPHTDEMAGSDLDGDEYSVIWRPSLVFSRDNCAPMHFPCGEAIDLERPVTTLDILEFYCSFILNNQVGIIANSHLAWADYYSGGIFGRICHTLDHKYATALDFAKTGKNERLRNDEKPSLYPHFMMKSHVKPTYKSDRLLGKLFEANCYFQEVMDETAQQTTINYEPSVMLIHNKADQYRDEAKQMFDLYKSAVKQLMDQFGIESETALFSGSFTKAHKYLCAQNGSNDFQDRLSNNIDKLFKDFRSIFKSKMNGYCDELLAKASAWYLICFEENARNEDKYFGFAWIVCDYLAELAIQNKAEKHKCVDSDDVIFANQDVNSTFICRLIKRLVLFSYKEELYLDNFFTDYKIKDYLDSVSHEIIEKSQSSNSGKMPPMNEILMNILKNLSYNENSYSEDLKYKIRLIASMALFRLYKYRDIGVLLNGKRESHTITVASLAITPRLANLIIANEEKFIESVKRLSSDASGSNGVNEMVVRYCGEFNDSMVTVLGSKCAIQKCVALLTDRYIRIERFLK